MIHLLGTLLILLFSSPAWSATYYTTKSGSDSNSCAQAQSEATAKLTINAGAACITAPGDKLYIGPGTYVESLLYTAFSVSGTQANPITISNIPGQARPLIQPNTGCYGILIDPARNWFVYENIDLSGINMNSCALISAGSLFSAGGSSGPIGSIFRNMDIADSPGSNLFNGDNLLIEYVAVHGTGWRAQAIGYGPGSNGIYATKLRNSRLRRVVTYNNMCNGLRVYNSEVGTAANNNDIGYVYSYGNGSGKGLGGTAACSSGGGAFVIGDANNTLHHSVGDDGGLRCIWVVASAAGTTGTKLHNNACTRHTYGLVFQTTAVMNTTVSNNFFLDNVTSNISGTGTGTVFQTNISTGTISTYTPGAGIFTHKSGSAAINAGTNVGYACNGVCDIGPFEAFTPVAATIDVTFLDVTFNPISGPIRVGGATGHSVGCSPTCGTITVSNASVLSGADSIARLNTAGWTGGECLSSQTITTSFNSSTGTITDSIDIGGLGTLNQPAHSYGPLAVTNHCSGTGSPTFPGGAHVLYELDGNETDTSGNGLNGTRTGGSYVAGKYGQALQGTAGTAVRVASPYGSGVNPSTQSLTIIVGYEVPAGAEMSTRTVAGAAFSSGNNLAISTIGGTWQINVQNSSVSAATPSNLPVVSGWNRLCLRIDSSTDTATLTVNNVTGTGGASKSYTSYTLGGNISFGLPESFNAVVGGGGKWDKAAIYTSLVSCDTDWLAWEPSSGPSTGTYAHTASRWYRVMDNGAGGPVLYSTASTVNAVQGGAIIHQSQTDCTGGNCSAIGEKLWYKRNGGEAQEVPNTFTSDGVAFWGSTTVPHMYLGTATCCISGSLSANHGTTQIQNVAQPSIDLDQNHSIVRNSVLRFAQDATGTFCFHERDQNGNELSSAVEFCVTLIPPQANGAH